MASVLKEMKKAGAVYHDVQGHCVTYQRGKGGTYVGKINTEEVLILADYPINRRTSGSLNKINSSAGRNMSRLMQMLGQKPAQEEE